MELHLETFSLVPVIKDVAQTIDHQVQHLTQHCEPHTQKSVAWLATKTRMRWSTRYCQARTRCFRERSCPRPCGCEQASGMIIDGSGQEEAICGVDQPTITG